MDLERERRKVESEACGWWRERQQSLICERIAWGDRGGIEGYGMWVDWIQTYNTFIY